MTKDKHMRVKDESPVLAHEFAPISRLTDELVVARSTLIVSKAN